MLTKVQVTFSEIYILMKSNLSWLQNFKKERAIKEMEQNSKRNEKQQKNLQNWKQIERKLLFMLSFIFFIYGIVTNSHDKFKSF